MLDISVWDISGIKKSRFGPVAEPSVAIIVILCMEIAGIVILMSVTSGTVAAPSLRIFAKNYLRDFYHSRIKFEHSFVFWNLSGYYSVK